MINYLKKNLPNFILGCIIGIPLALIAVHNQSPYRFKKEIPHIVIYTGQAEMKINNFEYTKGDVVVQELICEELKEEAYYDSLDLLACCVEAEAGNQGLEGKKYVVDVVLNRVDDSDFPNSITDVILQMNAFSVVLDGRINQVSPTEETFQAIEEELQNRTNYEVLYFTSEGYSKYGSNWKKIGDHYFSRK